MVCFGPGVAVKIIGFADLLDEVVGLQVVFWDAHECEKDGWNGNLYEQGRPAGSAKGVPRPAGPALKQEVLPQNCQELPFA